MKIKMWKLPLALTLLLPTSLLLLGTSSAFAAEPWFEALNKSCRDDKWSVFNDKLEADHADLKKHVDALNAKDYVDKDLLETDARVRMVAFTWPSDLTHLDAGSVKAFKNCYEAHREVLKVIGDLVMTSELKLATVSKLENCLGDFFRQTPVKSSSVPFGPLIACYKERAKKR